MFYINYPKVPILQGFPFKICDLIFTYEDDSLKDVVDRLYNKYLSIFEDRIGDRDKIDDDEKLLISLNIDTTEFLENFPSNEVYYIHSNVDFVEIVAKTKRGLISGLSNFFYNAIFNEYFATYEVIDYPTTKERRVHLDCGRKYFTKDWIINFLDFMCDLNLNTLNFHFSDNKGYRIESKVAPEIVSKDGYLTFDEISEILSHAKKLDIKIIPSFDTPGHVDHILKIHPEFALKSIDGKPSKIALDITSSEAVDFVKKLYMELLSIFKEQEEFHIGGDEFMEFHKDEFINEYQPVLDNYAHEKYGKKYSWKDAFVGYINEIYDLFASHGKKVRIWNDGIFYGENNPSIPKQKIKPSKDINIDYWCIMPWTENVVPVETFIKKGYKNIYNSNSDYLYYVLREEMPEDGRPMHSWNFKNAYLKIYENWSPGKFSGSVLKDKNPNIKGTSISIWCDNKYAATEKEIFNDIIREFIVFSLNNHDLEKENFGDMVEMIDELESWFKME